MLTSWSTIDKSSEKREVGSPSESRLTLNENESGYKI